MRMFTPCYFIKTTVSGLKTCPRKVTHKQQLNSLKAVEWELTLLWKNTEHLIQWLGLIMFQLEQKLLKFYKNEVGFISFLFPPFCSWSQWLPTWLFLSWSSPVTWLISRPALLHRPRQNMSSCITRVAAEATGLLCWVFWFGNWFPCYRGTLFSVFIKTVCTQYWRQYVMIWGANIYGLLLFSLMWAFPLLSFPCLFDIIVPLPISAVTPHLTKRSSLNPHSSCSAHL